MTLLRIAVIGAGPAGLTLARVLRHAAGPSRPLDLVVYDGEDGPAARAQGGTLDMHRGSGQTALERAGLLAAFLAAARPEGQDMRLLGHDGTVLFEHLAAEGEDDNPEIDRGDLRRLLLDALPAGTVRWGHRLESARAVGDGRHRLAFGNGAVDEVDLLVGADGAWSRVRPLVSAAVPGYSGVTFVEFRLDDLDTAHPDLATLAGRGSMSAPFADRSLITQRNARGVLRGYAAVRRSLGDTDLPDDPAALRAALLATFSDYAPPLREFLRRAEPDSFVVRPIMALPVPHTWEHRRGVTLLGDAAHLMSPFSGQGANLAMLDGSDLALALLEAHVDRGDPDGPDALDAAVRAVEDTVAPRGAAAAAGAADGLARSIAPDAPAHSLAFLTELLGT